jgi:hypothetical protein
LMALFRVNGNVFFTMCVLIVLFIVIAVFSAA